MKGFISVCESHLACMYARDRCLGPWVAAVTQTTIVYILLPTPHPILQAVYLTGKCCRPMMDRGHAMWLWVLVGLRLLPGGFVCFGLATAF
ncbi:hypothetical protein F4803DRAFT_517603, partial [Xylaria telfairii]